MNPIHWLFDFVLNVWLKKIYILSILYLWLSVSVCKHEGIIWLAGGDLWKLRRTHGSFTSPPALPASHTEQNHADTTPSVQPTAMSSQQAETPHRSARTLTSNTDFDTEWTANWTCAAVISISSLNVRPIHFINGPCSQFPKLCYIVSWRIIAQIPHSKMK